MGSSPERLEAEIERTREQLAGTVGEIGERVEQRVDTAREKVTATREAVRPANLARNPKVRATGGVLAGLYVLRALARRRRRRRVAAGG